MKPHLKPARIAIKSGKKLLVRPPQTSDLDQLLNFINALIKEDTFIAMAGKPKTKKEEAEWLKNTLKNIQKKETICLLAFDNQKLVANSSIDKRLGRFSHIADFGITVAKKYRGQKIGFNLASLVLEEAYKIGIRIAALEVFGNNSRARRLYQKLGFDKYGILPKSLTYRNQIIDLIQMYKRLP